MAPVSGMPVLECEGFGVHAYDVDTEREANTHKKRAPHVRCPFVESAISRGYAASRFLLK